MPQFRPLPSFQEFETTEVTGAHTIGDIFTTSSNKYLPLIWSTDEGTAATSGQITAISDQHPLLKTEQLATITGFTGPLPISSTTGRILKIPGSRKSEQTTEKLPECFKGQMSLRLRQGIVLVTILLVVFTTLVSLTPLNNGQSAIPLFRSIDDWIHTQQLDWRFQAHSLPTVQKTQNTSNNVQSNPAPPQMNLPGSAYVGIAEQDALNAGIPPDYFARQINMESGFNPNAHSWSGAEGIAQFMPATAAGLGINPWDPYAALNAAAHLMAGYVRNYGGNYAMALAAYNGGSGTVQYAVRACGSSNWMNCLPGETRYYIRVIMGV